MYRRGDRSLMNHLPLEVADRERLSNQSRTISLLSWAASLLFIGFALLPGIRNQPIVKALFVLTACAMTAVSKSTACSLALHDRVIQDFRDISDDRRQQWAYELLSPKKMEKVEEIVIDEPPPIHNLSQTISQTLKSTVLLGAPRTGKGYAMAKAVQLLPDTVDLWLIDPKDDPNESFYWSRVPVQQRCRFDVTVLNPEAVDDKVQQLFERYLLAASTQARPKLLIVDECAPGLAKGMTPRAYKAFMGRLSTICSVGPSRGRFVWIMAQASTVDDLAMSSGNKASFRLCAVGHAESTEISWFTSLQRSMQIELPAEQLTGYIQMLGGQWGYSEPFEVDRAAVQLEDQHRAEVPLSSQSREVLSYIKKQNEPIALRRLTQASFARRVKLTTQTKMLAAIKPLIDAALIEQTEDGDYQPLL